LKNPFTLSASPDLLEAPRNAEKSAGLHPLRNIDRAGAAPSVDTT
jgi:hypothetical protein